MSGEKNPEVAPVKGIEADNKPVDWKKERSKNKKFYDSIMFKGIKIGYTGGLMDDENIPF